jgi:hypothetical protein
MTCPIGQCMAIGTGWSKWPPKDIHMSSNARPLGAASLSYTKYKNYFIKNIHYFGTRLYIIIKIY